MSALLCLAVTQQKGLKASIAATEENTDPRKEDSMSFPVPPISLWPFPRSAIGVSRFPTLCHLALPVLIRSVWRSRLIAWRSEVREPWPGKCTLQLNPSLTKNMRSGCYFISLGGLAQRLVLSLSDQRWVLSQFIEQALTEQAWQNVVF